METHRGRRGQGRWGWEWGWLSVPELRGKNKRGGGKLQTKDCYSHALCFQMAEHMSRMEASAQESWPNIAPDIQRKETSNQSLESWSTL